MSKRWVILGGGGSFGIHTAFWLLKNADPEKVVGIGRNPLRPGPFSLGIESEKRYSYHARHLTYELDLLMEVLDKERPHYIVNYAAQGEGGCLVEEFVAIL
jgi:dTDP-glucose 4,6-dehydratase